ncbi:hypothetical protein T4E_2588, partial [Trichinella pseudospiralis]
LLLNFVIMGYIFAISIFYITCVQNCINCNNEETENFLLAIQDLLNEKYIKGKYYIANEMKSTVLLPPFLSTKINFQISNCTRKQFPIGMVRNKNGCYSIGSTNDAIICTALHRGLHVPFQKYMEPLLQCYKANSSATFEAEKKIFLHWKFAYANLVSGLE